MKIKYEKIDSTNQEAKRLIKEDKESKLKDNINLIYADYQTNGKGTKGHTWNSNGDDIYMTITSKIEDNLNYPKLMMYTSISIIKILEKYIDEKKSKDIKVKWPNDIYIKDKKIAGILFEKIIKGEDHFILIGIGLNVNRKIDSLENDNRKITSIYLEENKEVSKDKIIEEIYLLIEEFLKDQNKSDKNNEINYKINYEDIYKEYLDKSLILNKNIEIVNLKNDMKKEKYLVKNILKNGKLICLNNNTNKEEKFLFNDIDIISINK